MVVINFNINEYNCMEYIQMYCLTEPKVKIETYRTIYSQELFIYNNVSIIF